MKGRQKQNSASLTHSSRTSCMCPTALRTSGVRWHFLAFHQLVAVVATEPWPSLVSSGFWLASVSLHFEVTSCLQVVRQPQLAGKDGRLFCASMTHITRVLTLCIDKGSWKKKKTWMAIGWNPLSVTFRGCQSNFFTACWARKQKPKASYCARTDIRHVAPLQWRAAVEQTSRQTSQESSKNIFSAEKNLQCCFFSSPLNVRKPSTTEYCSR